MRSVERRERREERPEPCPNSSINEYEPNTGNSDAALSDAGFEYGFVLEGVLTVEVDKTPCILKSGDLISYNSRRAHKIWNYGRRKVRNPVVQP
jgi:uncharacterized cupin superfamily protein